MKEIVMLKNIYIISTVFVSLSILIFMLMTKYNAKKITNKTSDQAT
jgi:membrane-bound acyltransferase YfiQ involved in biofilm formation